MKDLKSENLSFMNNVKKNKRARENGVNNDKQRDTEAQ